MDRLIKAYFLFIFVLVNNLGFAEEHLFDAPKESGKRILIGYGGNYPLANSAKTYESSLYHPIIGVRHISEDWVLGLSTQFKFLKNKETLDQVPLWSLEQEISYRIRLYHPFYL